jgi:NAD(P)-dependent dehydrogenase (short-subunit alcohol dehydrogenase family)
MHHTAIVTGGAQGIGRGITRRLIAAGWKVLVLDKDPAGIAHARLEFSDPGVCRFLRGDCGKPQTARRAIAVIQKSFGRLDLLVNNAGGSGFAPFEKQTPAGWHQAIDANLSSTFFFSQAAAPLLSLHKGAIVNIASTRALQSEPNSEAYAAAKGGVVALTHALAASLRHRVRVNAICPGWIDVSDPSLGPGRKPIKISAKDKAQHWCGRVGTPDDIADAVCYLAQATFVSGQILVVDGGMTKTMIYE